MTPGCVYLVGAGPGDPGLLTLRAVDCIRAADVVAYDELISEPILAMIPARCERLSVGRRHGQGPTPYRLHPSVLSMARAGKRVVRLKAGDPMVFGRGGEEAEELAEAGIPFEIIPGVSAALGAAAYAGIPLTHRDHAGHVILASGHPAAGVGAQGAARRPGAPIVNPGRALGEERPGTVVLYMAARRLEENLQRIVNGGRSADTPAAIIASATTPEQRVIVGDLATLPARAAELPSSAPAIVIVGEVVSLRERIDWLGQRRSARGRSPE